MGEYYQWVNVDKKEYICPEDFDYGSNFTNLCTRTVLHFMHFIVC